MTHTLVGPHRAIVDQLFDRVRSIQRSNASEARVIILDAPSGSGKTAIVRALYDKLQKMEAKRNTPSFWPALEEWPKPDGAQRARKDPLPERKVIGPPPHRFVWRRGSVPTFGWWAFHCDRNQVGGHIDLVQTASEQFKAFAPGLMLASSSKHPFLRDHFNAKEIHQLISDAGKVELEAILDETLQSVIADSIPLWNTLKLVATRVSQAASEHVAARTRMRSDQDLGRGIRADHIERMANLGSAVADLSSPEIPGIVVIEDAHLMDEDFDVFLRTVTQASAQSDNPVLVVATTWSEGRTNPQIASWLRTCLQESIQYEIIQVPALSTDELGELVLREAPETEHETVQKIVQTLNNPFFLKLWLSSGKVQRQLRKTKAIRLDRTTVELPVYAEDVILDRWLELDEDVRTALGLIAQALDCDNGLASFAGPIVAEAAARSEVMKQKSATRALALSIDPAFWCRYEGDPSILYFAERMLYDHARRAGEDEYSGTEELEQFLLEVVAAAEKELLSNWTSAEWFADTTSREEVLARTIITGYRRLALPETRALALAYLKLALRLASTFDFSTAVQFSEKSFHLLVKTGYDPAQIALAKPTIIPWLVAIGHYEKLTELCTEVLTLAPSADASFYSTIHFSLALGLLESGFKEQAILHFRANSELTQSIFGDKSVEVFEANLFVVMGLLDAGRENEGWSLLNALEARYPELARVFDGEIAEIRHSSSSSGLGGSPDEVEEVLSRLVAKYGKYSIRTFNVHTKLAEARVRNGQVDAGFATFEELLHGIESTCGTQTLYYIRALRALAQSYKFVGRYEEELSTLRTVVTLSEQVLGESSLDTIMSTNSLVARLWECGRYQDSLRLASIARARAQATLPLSDASRLYSEFHYACLLEKHGRLGEANTVLQSIIAPVTQLTGDFQLAEKVLGSLVRVSELRGDTKLAIHHLEQLCEFSDAFRDPDDEVTLHRRFVLELLRLQVPSTQSENSSSVATLALIEEKYSALDTPADESLLEMRTHLAEAYRLLGDTDGLLSVLGKTLDTMKAMGLPDDHPKVIQILNELRSITNDFSH